MRKGIILAGGTGSRLKPVTAIFSKQLIPVYDKPMIYYPLSVLMLAGIRDILIITNPGEKPLFERLLGDGSQWGLSLHFRSQPHPGGIAQAYQISADFVGSSPSALILGDNLFFGSGLARILEEAGSISRGATIFGYHVADPSAYAVVEFTDDQKVTSLEEKPKGSKSPYAVPGLYFYDSRAVDFAQSLLPSSRGELEITDLNCRYMEAGDLNLKVMGAGISWIDGGTPDSLLDAALLIKIIEDRQGLKVCCPEEVAWRMGFISDEQLEIQAEALCGSGYGEYLLKALGAGRRRRSTTSAGSTVLS